MRLFFALLVVLIVAMLVPVVHAQASQKADITWVENATATAPVTGTKLFRKVGSAGTPTLITPTPLAPGTTSFTDVGPLIDGQQYCYIVTTMNALGDAPRRTGDEGCAIGITLPAGATGVNVNIHP